MSAASGANYQRINASRVLARNNERRWWKAKIRAARFLDEEPGPVSRSIADAVDGQWAQAYMELD
jgi:hypothetical protein